MRVPRSWLALGLMALSGIALAATPTLAESLLAGLAQTPPVATPFVKVSYRGVLSRPLIVSGTLKWFGGDRMERDITKPFKETAKIGAGELSVRRGHGEVRRVPLAHAPQVAAMLAGFRALLGGDVAALKHTFSLSAQGSQAYWVVTLTPRSDALKSRVASIVIDGRNHSPRCLTVHDANGDTSITLVGKMAKAGLRSAVPQESALAAYCRNQR